MRILWAVEILQLSRRRQLAKHYVEITVWAVNATTPPPDPAAPVISVFSGGARQSITQLERMMVFTTRGKANLT